MNHELYHHGILGQKWGRRRYQNADGSLTAEGRKRYNVGDKTTKSESSKSSSRKKINREKAAKIIAATAGASAASLAAYATYRNFNKSNNKTKNQNTDTQGTSNEKKAKSGQNLSLEEKRAYIKAASEEQAYRKIAANNSKTKMAKDIVDESQKAIRAVKQLSDESIKNGTQKIKMDLSKMSDKEMRDKINRELLERQYNSLFAPEVSTVSKGQKILNDTLAIAGSVLAVGSSSLGIALAIKQLKG